MNSIVRVTNLRNQKSVVVRITDRGPFDPNRIIDLSVASAKAIDLWKLGTGPVRLDVLQAPAPLSSGGRWCVQIGAFENRKAASRLKEKLMRRYHSAQVLQFTSPTGKDWLRVRVAGDDKHLAELVVRETTTPQGHVFLVRLD